MAVRSHVLTVAGCMTVLVGSQFLAEAASDQPQSKLDASLADLKVKTTTLVSFGLAQLKALPPQQRLAAPPAIWRVPGAVTDFRDCADCPQMVVIPAGEFTMGSPPSEMQAEAQHRVTIAYPFAVGKFAITFNEWEACLKDGGCDGYLPDDQGWGGGKRTAPARPRGKSPGRPRRCVISGGPPGPPPPPGRCLRTPRLPPSPGNPSEFCNGKIDFGKLSSLGQITPSQALDAFISAECLRFDRLSCAAQ